MNTRIPEAVIAVAEEGSQTKAAERLMITPPALSQILKKLEQDLGTPLFQKEKNGLVLTDAGKIYVNGAKAAINIYYNALNDLRKIRTRKRRQITLVYNHYVLKNISGVISNFISDHPDIYISTIYGNASTARDYLINGMADLAVTPTKELSNSMLGFLPLCDEELQLAVPYGHPMISQFRKSGVNFDFLENDFFILHQEGSFLYNAVQDLFHQKQFRPKSFCEVSETDVAISMVSNHHGISFIPKSQFSNGKYIPFSLNPPEIYHIAISYRKDNLLTGALRELIILLLKQYEAYS